MKNNTLHANLTWKTPVLLSAGIGLLILVSTGSMAGELGGASFWVWVLTTLMGALQCILIYLFSKKYPYKAGGTATYAVEAITRGGKFWGGVSMWGYWLAWTPGIAINSLLAVSYVQSAFVLPGNKFMWVGFALAILYCAHYFGHKTNMRVITAFALISLLPFATIVAALLLFPHATANSGLFDFSLFTFKGFMKWAFVAAWTAYGAEMASNLVAELKDSKGILKSIGGAVFVCTLLLIGLPFLLLIAVGPQALGQDPTVSLLPVSLKLFGTWGFKIVSLIIAAGLLLGAQAFVIGSSRTLYQMSEDGILPLAFKHLNKYGTPYKSIMWDLIVIGILLAVFGTNIVNIVAAANIGYIVVFLLLGIASMLSAKEITSTQLQRTVVRILGAFVLLVNIFLLFIGGSAWGGEVFWVGIALLFSFLPLYWWRKKYSSTI